MTYEKQGLIYFTCANYKMLPSELQQKILNLCVTVGGENYQALFVLLTETERKIESITKEYDISLKMLCNLRKKFYEEWERYIQSNNTFPYYPKKINVC